MSIKLEAAISGALSITAIVLVVTFWFWQMRAAMNYAHTHYCPNGQSEQVNILPIPYVSCSN